MRGEIDPRFAAYARAREPDLLARARAGPLGEDEAREAVIEALAWLAEHWATVGHDNPGAALDERLEQILRRRTPGPDSAPATRPPAEEPAAAGEWSPSGTLPARGSGNHPPGDGLGPAAWARARARVVRRRRLLLGGGALAVAAAASFAVRARGTDDLVRPHPTPSLATTSSGDGHTPEQVHDRATGTRLTLLPDDAALAALPASPRPMLPEWVPVAEGAQQMPAGGLGGRRILLAWVTRHRADPTVTVLLADGQRYRLPHFPAPWMGPGPFGPVLPPRAIGKGGQRIFYVQDDKLAALDVDDRRKDAARMKARVAFPVLDGAWTPGGKSIVLVGDDTGMLVDSTTGAERDLREPAPGGYYQLAIETQWGATVPTVTTWDDTAHQTSRHRYPLPIARVSGPTFSSLSGWAAAAVRPDTAAILPADRPRPQAGVAAISGDSPNRKELLVDAPESADRVRCALCVQPVGWASGSDLLVRLRGEDEDVILRWDTVTGRLWRECRIAGARGYSLAFASAA